MWNNKKESWKMEMEILGLVAVLILASPLAPQSNRSFKWSWQNCWLNHKRAVSQQLRKKSQNVKKAWLSYQTHSFIRSTVMQHYILSPSQIAVALTGNRAASFFLFLPPHCVKTKTKTKKLLSVRWLCKRYIQHLCHCHLHFWMHIK